MVCAKIAKCNVDIYKLTNVKISRVIYIYITWKNPNDFLSFTSEIMIDV